MSPAQTKTENNIPALKSVKLTWFVGEKKVGFSKAEGIMMIYSDHLEYHFKASGMAVRTAASIAFGAVGAAVSSAMAKKKDALIFPMRDIAKVKESKFGAGYPALILEMRDGNSHTFSGGYRLKQDIAECVNLIEGRIASKPVEQVLSVTEEGSGQKPPNPSNPSIHYMTDRQGRETQRQQLEARKQELIREISAMYSADPRCEGKFAELNRIEAQLRAFAYPGSHEALDEIDEMRSVYAGPPL